MPSKHIVWDTTILCAAWLRIWDAVLVLEPHCTLFKTPSYCVQGGGGCRRLCLTGVPVAIVLDTTIAFAGWWRMWQAVLCLPQIPKPIISDTTILCECWWRMWYDVPVLQAQYLLFHIQQYCAQNGGGCGRVCLYQIPHTCYFRHHHAVLRMMEKVGGCASTRASIFHMLHTSDTTMLYVGWVRIWASVPVKEPPKLVLRTPSYCVQDSG